MGENPIILATIQDIRRENFEVKFNMRYLHGNISVTTVGNNTWGFSNVTVANLDMQQKFIYQILEMSFRHIVQMTNAQHNPICAPNARRATPLWRHHSRARPNARPISSTYAASLGDTALLSHGGGRVTKQWVKGGRTSGRYWARVWPRAGTMTSQGCRAPGMGRAYVWWWGYIVRLSAVRCDGRILSKFDKKLSLHIRRAHGNIWKSPYVAPHISDTDIPMEVYHVKFYPKIFTSNPPDCSQKYRIFPHYV